MFDDGGERLEHRRMACPVCLTRTSFEAVMRTTVSIPMPNRQGKPTQTARAFLAASLVGIMLMAGSALAANKTKLSIYQHGKPVSDLPCGTQALQSRTAVLMGGGVDVAGSLSWMIDKMARCGDGSKGKPGNFVVVRAGGNPAYDSYIYKLGTLASVITIVVPDRDSALAIEDPSNEIGQQVQRLLKNAGAIWLTGGDQSDYYNFWIGTQLEKLMSSQVQAYGVPIGGTSAGMVILSEFNFVPDIAYSSDYALSHPSSMKQWLRNDFWSDRTPFLPLTATVTESHLDIRTRMGRLVTLLADVIAMGFTAPNSARAIGVDEQTALAMEYVVPTSGNPSKFDVALKVFANAGSNGSAYILTPGSGGTLSTAGALTFTMVNVQKLSADGSSKTYQINVNGGAISSTTGSLY